MKLMKLVMLEVPGMVEDCVSRQYDTNYTAGMVDDVLRATKDGTSINPRTVAEVASRIIAPIGDPIRIGIENGWQQERFKVGMLVELEQTRYATEAAYIVGYTDGGTRDRTTLRGGTDRMIDPDTRIYINQVTRVAFRKHSHGKRDVWAPNLTSSNNVLRRDSIDDRRGRHSDKPYLTRPTDLFRMKDSESNNALATLRSHPDAVVRNQTGRFAQNIIFSSAENSISAAHLNKSISAVISGQSDPMSRTSHGVDRQSTMDGAIDRLDEARIEEDPFFNAMRNDSDIIRSGYVTYQELLDASDNWTDDKTNIFKVNAEKIARFKDAQRWSGSNPETIAAQILANGLPSILINAMYSRVLHLVIDTDARLGQRRVIAGGPLPFVEGLDPLATVGYFEDAVDDILVKDATNNNAMALYAEIDADIDGEIEIKISIDHGDMETYIYPAWASGLLTPTITTDDHVMDRLSSSIVSLATDVAAARSQRYSNAVDEPIISLNSDVSNARNERDRGRSRDRDDRSSRDRDNSRPTRTLSL